MQEGELLGEARWGRVGLDDFLQEMGDLETLQHLSIIFETVARLGLLMEQALLSQLNLILLHGEVLLLLTMIRRANGIMITQPQ